MSDYDHTQLSNPFLCIFFASRNFVSVYFRRTISSGRTTLTETRCRCSELNSANCMYTSVQSNGNNKHANRWFWTKHLARLRPKQVSFYFPPKSYLFTPHSRLLDKLTVAQLIQILGTLCGTQQFTTVFTNYEPQESNPRPHAIFLLHPVRGSAVSTVVTLRSERYGTRIPIGKKIVSSSKLCPPLGQVPRFFPDSKTAVALRSQLISI